MAASLNQLFLLLWKSWKTQIRSKKWLIGQLVITLLMWTGVYMVSKKTDPGEPFKTMHRPDDTSKFKGKEYRCLTEGFVCSPEMKASLTQVCGTMHERCMDREVDDPFAEGCFNCPKSHQMSIREFSQSAIDIDYNSMWECSSSSYSSIQFDNLFTPNPQSCGGGIFDRFAKQSGKLNKLEISILKPLSHKTDHTEARWQEIQIAFMIPMVFFCAQVTLGISQEASSQIKDYLLSVGMSRIFYFAHHFIFHFLKIWIPVIGCSIVLGVIYKSGRMALYLTLLFSLALPSWINLSMVVGTCFRRPAIAAFVNLVLMMTMSFVPLPFIRTSYLCLLSSLIPNMAVSLALDSKRKNELRDVNIWFSEVSQAVPQGYFMIMLIVDAVIFFWLAILIDFMRTSFENPLSLLRRSKLDVDEGSKKSYKDNREKSEGQTNADLVIEGIHKIYSSGEHAVRGIDMRMYKGQVTALLGHNGAGKSTTFSMISGMVAPTRGKIQIMDEESREGRQKLIGYCPQYNAVFPKLTVDEHLYFFARLKGVDSTNGEAVLAALGMSDKGASQPHELSGGMKRKLCIAIAFAANSPIILLDEPTAGMDTGARRDFERLLLERKKEHTILLTTHYTDEAELLADRLFIMARGKVFCSGSSQFLRKKFDTGFVLSFAVQNESETDKACEEIMKIAKEFVPDVSVYKKRAKQFELKLSTDDMTRFCEMFRKIEADGPSLGMQSYGLSMNKLEQVFLKVGELTGTVDRTQEVNTALKELINENANRTYGSVKVLSQFGNNLLKRLYYDIAHIVSLFFMLLVLFGVTYAIFNIMLGSQGKASTDTKDLLAIYEIYRIGIDSSLHDKFDEIKRISKLFGNNLIIDKDSTILNWYNTHASSRPPILGGLSRSGDDWTIHLHPRNEHLLPTLEAIAAMINNPALTKVKFHKKGITVSQSKHEENSERARQSAGMMQDFYLIMLSPFMIIRPISFTIVERISNFHHQERLTGISPIVLLLSSITYDFFLFLLHFIVSFASALTVDHVYAWRIGGILFIKQFIGSLSGEMIIRLLCRNFSSHAMGEIIIFFLMEMGSIFIFFVGGTFAMITGVKEFATILPMANVGAMKDGRISVVEGAIFLILHFSILTFIFILIEFKLISKWTRRRNNVELNEAEAKPSDESLVLKVRNLEKWYGSNKEPTVAVNGISFGVHAHECFGVLGINGAGKTSTFEVLTGNTLPTGGTATVGGVDCSTPATIGYCPQMDALLEDLSGRQSLVILAALHGYENPRTVADIVITCVGMQEHADKKSISYSGGQRRKISVAASLLAQNSLIILDEPTAGIDPIARRDIWSVICALRESTNTAIVLTSHSMDEVEALVSNMIIMRAGSIVVEGSPQMIKNQYGAHYNFNLVIENVTDVGQITNQVLSVFPYASLYDSASLRNIKYRISRHSSDIFSEIFQKASTLARELNATDFCFTQATLEDAFMLAATVKTDVENARPAEIPTLVRVEQPEVTATEGKTSGSLTRTPTMTAKE